MVSFFVIVLSFGACTRQDWMVFLRLLPRPEMLDAQRCDRRRPNGSRHSMSERARWGRPHARGRRWLVPPNFFLPFLATTISYERPSLRRQIFSYETKHTEEKKTVLSPGTVC